jgi:cellulose synthase/poly-beta-1,6-N-acetylglucosamine synthase-like glycosyltransferase
MNRLAIVKTYPSKSLNLFYNQRKRWASKGLFYSNYSLIIKLVLIFLYYLSFPAQLILGIFYNPFFFITMCFSFIVKGLLEFMIIKAGTIRLFNPTILHPFITAEILHIPYILIAGISGIFGNYSWKNKKIKR